MAGGILSLLREIFSDKMADLDRNYYTRGEDVEKQLAKKNLEFREIMKKLEAKEKLKLDLNDEIDELEQTKHKLVPSRLNARDKAQDKLKKEYLELRVKATLDGIPKEKLKKLVEDFQSKDFLAEAMGV